jgi:transcriptional regulator with PAS, ATPase and Fis domain
MGIILFACADEGLTQQVKAVVGNDAPNTEIITTNRDSFGDDLKKIDKEITVIVSRGGLGQFISKNYHYHVVYMRISLIDMFAHILALKNEGAEHIAIVGTDAWLEVVNDNSDEKLLGCKIFSVGSREKQVQLMRELPSMGFDALITGASDMKLAESLGLKCKPLFTSANSVARAYEEAKFISNVIKSEQLRTKQVRTLLDSAEDALVMLGNSSISYANAGAKKLFGTDFSYERMQDYLHMHNVTTMIDDNPMLVNSTTYSLDDNSFGSILSFKYAAAIHRSERILRNAQTKGFIARHSFDSIISESNTMKRCIESAKQYAACDSNILITGETGTGKELFAQSLHNASMRKDMPFVSINCASIPADILEGELFGRAEQSSGVRRPGKYGLFELAHGGTLFLDEISSMPLPMQARLLRVLQEKELFRIGDEKVIPVDVRIICSTNRDLPECISKGTFRADLYYRINVLELDIPSLRARKADIGGLFKYFINMYGNRYKFPVRIQDRDCIKLLEDYSWPGNVRELKNIAERSVLLCHSGVITKDFLADLLVSENSYISARNSELNPKKHRKPDREELERLLQVYSKKDICAMLGISRTTLWRMESEL